MFWEELSVDGFREAVATCEGVCLLPLSCIEGHGPHLPLATDMYIGREVCRRAAEIEPAVIFPDFIFTQIIEARHCSGTIALPVELIMQLCEAVFKECARNGLRKIILVNAHGGNRHIVGLLTQSQLIERHDYILYVWQPQHAPEDSDTISRQWRTTVDGHAGESETSQMLAIRPELVALDRLRDANEGLPKHRLAELAARGVLTGIWWYADHPYQYCGDGSSGTKEKGEVLLASEARELSRVIRLVREDSETERLQDEFYRLAQGHNGHGEKRGQFG